MTPPLCYPAYIWMDLTVRYTNSIWVRYTNNRSVGPSGYEHSLSRDTYFRKRVGVRVHTALTCFACVFIIPHQVGTSSARRSHAALVEFSIADYSVSNFPVDLLSEQRMQNYLFIYIQALELNHPKTRDSVFDLFWRCRTLINAN
jgi:hypothetical protein